MKNDPIRTARTMQPIRVIVVCEFFDDRGFGLSEACLGFTNNLVNCDLVALVSIHPLTGREDCQTKIHHLGSWWVSRWKDASGLVELASELDASVIHFHGVWTAALRHIPKLRQAGRTVLVSPHGMLEPYLIQRNRVAKAIFSRCIQRQSLLDASLLHALNPTEADRIRDYVGKEAPIAVISNGVVNPLSSEPLPSEAAFLFCGRFDHKKNIELLLDAWELAALDNWKLLLAGDGHGGYADMIRKRASSMKGVELLGLVSGPSKQAAFARSRFGVLTSRSEGQPMALLESLAAGRPVIATSGSRLPDILQQNIGWLADDADGICAALRSAAQLSELEYERISRNAVNFATARHSWKSSGMRLAELYRDLSDKQGSP